MNIELIMFYGLSAILILSALLVITAKNPVKGVLFLVLAFVSSSVIWMMLEAEFLSLVLIFVYVGAVMTLFLFVVMMLNLDLVSLREGFVRYLPLGIILTGILISLIFYVVTPKHFPFGSSAQIIQHAENYSNVKELGGVLYTQYVYPFEIASALLLVAIVAAISLAFRGKQNSKTQKISQQVSVQKEDRFYLVNLGKKS